MHCGRDLLIAIYVERQRMLVRVATLTFALIRLELPISIHLFLTCAIFIVTASQKEVDR